MATRRDMKVFWKHRHSYLKFKVAFNTLTKFSKDLDKEVRLSVGNMRYSDFFRGERFKDRLQGSSLATLGHKGFYCPHTVHLYRINRKSTQLERTPSIHTAECTNPGLVFARGLVFLTVTIVETQYSSSPLQFLLCLYFWAMSATRTLIPCK